MWALDQTWRAGPAVRCQPVLRELPGTWGTCPVRRPPPRAKDSGSEEPRELERLGARRLPIWGSESREDRTRLSFLLLEGYLQVSSFGITMISFPDCKYNSFFFPKKFKRDEMHEFKHKRSSEITNAQC